MLEKAMLEKNRENDWSIIAYNEGIRVIDPGCIDNTIELISFMKEYT
ncbi:15935_t:CDS:2 [Funneliformis geosporum]|nr:15935_t:CDS:2 [Funneliformis geosporum]